MISRFITKNPDSLSLLEQVVSAVVAAILATVAAGVVVSLMFVAVMALL